VKVVLIFSQFCLSIFLFVGMNVHAEGMERDRLERVDYLYPANKDEVFVETVDEFYQALRDRKYPVHQAFYSRHQRLYTGNKH
jgi:hypothetical protein